ncbi:MAG: ribonuclease III [Schwartzia sp.]|nr:ribonuclease III [Schwartzia sp. (in: firmicutes)]
MIASGLTAARVRALKELSGRLGVRFRNMALLDQALTHTSYANEAVRRKVIHNERLEFLGDAVLELATSTYLFLHFPELPEGDLTKARASVVCEAALYRRAAEVSLGDYLLLGRGERVTGGDKRPSILADAFEAVIGALYLDQGWQAATDYVLDQLKEELVEVEHGHSIKDYKTMLQEVIQRHPGQRIVYELLAATGPDHAKVFKVAVRVNGLAYGVGTGRSKKAAEQSAAQQALSKFDFREGEGLGAKARRELAQA